MTGTADLDRLTTHCLFCNPAEHGQGHQIVLRSDHYYVFAALGAIHEGYLIITPYSCAGAGGEYRSISSLPRPHLDELRFLREIVAAYYRDRYGVPGLSFEHGRAGNCLISDTDTPHCYHPHLCCYPVDVPLWDHMAEHHSEEIDGVYDLAQRVGSAPYLYVEHCEVRPDVPVHMASRHRWVSRVVRLTDEERLESQYLRRTLATAVGVPEFWDWRTRPTFDAVARLVADFGTWITSVAGLVPVPNARGFAIDFTRSATRGNALGYDAVAGDYRRTWRRHLQYDAVGRFVSRLPARRTTGTSPRVLDLACGPGMYVKAFHHLGLRCVGTDISSGMLLEARRELAAELREAEPPLLLRMDNAAPALAKGAFDGVWFSAGLVHTPRPVAASTLANVRELLVDGGVLYLSAQVGAGLTVRHEGRVFVYYTEPELLALFRDAGFDVLERWDGITERGSVGDNRRKTWQHYLLAPVRRPAAPTGARPNPRSLAAVGERGLVAHLKSRLPQAHGRLVLAAGDDAAALAVPHGSLVVATVDPCPQPVLSLIEGPDRWVDGWYAMAISLSDLAAMGATPSGALLAVEMPPDSMMADLDRFYDGALAAAEAFDCPVIGGNVKDAERFSCVSVGLGYAAPDRLLRRDSAAPGDAVLVLGTMGLFWAAVFQSLQAVQLDRPDKERLRRAMRQPVPRLREGRVLADKGFSRCAIDSSDGVTACLHEIAVASGVDLHLDFTGVPVDPVVARVAEAVGIDVRKLLLAWGDWQLVCTVAPDIVGEVREAMARLGCPTHEVGWVGPGGGAVWVHESERTAPLNYVASERFSPRSYFTHGIEKYAAILREEPLTLSTEGGRGA